MTHEDFSRKLPQRKLRDRTFGLAGAGILSAVGLLPLLRHHPVRWYALAAAAALLAAALAAPRLIAPLHRALMRFGHAVSIVLSHLISAVLLLVAFAPARLFFRLGGQDPLALRWDARAPTYWIPKDPPGPPPATMAHQF